MERINHSLNNILTIVALTLLLAACGDIETTPTESPGNERTIPESTTKLRATPNGFTEEAYGVAAKWYNYRSETHVLDPKNFVYMVDGPEAHVLLEIVSYYNDQGDSGYMTIRAKKVAESDLGSTQKLQIEGSVKKGRVCLNVQSLETTSCNSDNWEVLFRTDYRIVPAAGFAPSNPAIYFAGHWSQDEKVEISRIEAEKMKDVTSESLEDATELRSAQHSRLDSMLGTFPEDRLPSDVFVQATPSQKVVQWQVTDITDGELEIRSRCADLATSPGQQTSLSDNEIATQTYELSDGSKQYAVQLASICNGDLVLEQSKSEPFEGLWPSTKTFSLLIEQTGDERSLRLPPGHLFWNATANAEGQPEDLEDVKIPAQLWE
jgi:hypothetical protein